MNQEELQDLGEHVVKKKHRNTTSIVDSSTATSAEISQIIGESFQYFKRPIVKSDEECAQRLEDYFNQCQMTGQIPTVEDMALALGTSRQTLFNWEHGLKGASAARQNMIKQAKEVLAGVDAKLVSMGKIPQVTYIFRAKNYFGLADKQEVVVTPNNPLDDGTKDLKTLEAEYVESVVTDTVDDSK